MFTAIRLLWEFMIIIFVLGDFIHGIIVKYIEKHFRDVIIKICFKGLLASCQLLMFVYKCVINHNCCVH